MKRYYFYALFLLISIPVINGFADEEQCCEECTDDCDSCRERLQYNPLHRYYPYCSIYQDSVVNENIGDEPASSYPSRRDGDFSDYFTR